MRSHAVIISPNPDRPTGGVERMCVLLGKVLEDDGWTVSIVGTGRQPGRWQFRLGGTYLVSSSRATRIGHAQNPDLLITNGYLGMGLSQKVPRVHVYHGTMVGNTNGSADSLSRREQIRRKLGGGIAEALAGRWATTVSVSDAVAREARRLYGVRTHMVIPNGIDTTVFSPRPRDEARARMGLSSDGRYTLYVGRMDYGKGADVLLPASQRSGFELLIAGPTGVDGARHLGVLTPEALADAYSAVDCVLFPSHYEACSYVVLEALACGAPLITTRVGWMSTLLEAVPAYHELCIQPTVDDISVRLKSFHDLDLARLRTEAREYVLENNSLARYAEHWRVLLKTLDLRT